VVAAFEATTHATTPMGRRWAAEGGPEGRGRNDNNGSVPALVMHRLEISRSSSTETARKIQQL